LVVDDEPDNSLLFRIALEDNGFDVDSLDDPTLVFLFSSLISMTCLYLILKCQR
jgi:DNA-binding response OmpR family regulator